MTFIGGLNQFSSIANHTLNQHLLEKKLIIKHIYCLYPGYQEHESKWQEGEKESTFTKSGEKKENIKNQMCSTLFSMIYLSLLPKKKIFPRNVDIPPWYA